VFKYWVLGEVLSVKCMT